MSDCPNCKRYREALGFYADPCQWERQVSAESRPYCMNSPVSNDMGSVARKVLREAESTPHPDTLRLEKLAKNLNHYYGAASGAECLLEWWQHVPGDVSPDDLRTYIDGLED